ncbi:Ion channel [Aliiroseovarius sediminilitoris]|uniref:Ion channel n=1 Tax=Aliiroseovarius sediminilitoris TaxID=1173584 RepID=A0A1I0PMV5_9RHOB|nr:Ion channel [Aliiroseovarius sediminilitoris]
MLLSIALSVSAFLLTAVMHLIALRWCSGGMAKIPLHSSTRVLAVLILLFSIHMLEIGIFAVAYALAERWLNLGAFAGEPIVTLLDYYYFSAITYTSLGIGDIFPTEHLRFLTGVEALIGLLLIAWSATFLYAMMNRLWVWQPCARPDGPPQDMSGQPPAAQGPKDIIDEDDGKV